MTEDTDWDWGTLRGLTFSSPETLKETLSKHYPEGASFIELDEDTGVPNKTSYSFLITLWSHAGTILTPLAAAWRDTPVDRKLSLTEWLGNEETARKAVILQRTSEFADLSQAWIGAAVQLLANHAASTGFGDSSDRRVWLFLDEFPQLGKLKGFQQFLEVGRSRGIRVALGVQDLEQLSDLYGKEAQKTWLNTIETKIICRMNAGPSAKFIAEELVGQREVSWTEKTVSHSSGDWTNGKPGTRSVNKQTRTGMVPVLMPDTLERELGPRQSGGETKIRALLMSGGTLLQLDWPIPHWPSKRAASEPADWTKE